MNSNIRFSEFDRIKIKNEYYRAVRQSSDGIVLESAYQTGLSISYTHEEILALLGSPDW